MRVYSKGGSQVYLAYSMMMCRQTRKSRHFLSTERSFVLMIPHLLLSNGRRSLRSALFHVVSPSLSPSETSTDHSIQTFPLSLSLPEDRDTPHSMVTQHCIQNHRLIGPHDRDQIDALSIFRAVQNSNLRRRSRDI